MLPDSGSMSRSKAFQGFQEGAYSSSPSRETKPPAFPGSNRETGFLCNQLNLLFTSVQVLKTEQCLVQHFQKSFFGTGQVLFSGKKLQAPVFHGSLRIPKQCLPLLPRALHQVLVPESSREILQVHPPLAAGSRGDGYGGAGHSWAA